jgi:hypothetical protein
MIGELSKTSTDSYALQQIVDALRIQTRYKLRMIKCVESIVDGVDYINGFLFFKTEKQFVLLPTRVVDNSNKSVYGIPVDAVSGLDGYPLNNALMYLQNHPAVQLASYCDMSAFYSPAGIVKLPDIRPDRSLLIDGANRYEQYVFILELINFV